LPSRFVVNASFVRRATSGQIVLLVGTAARGRGPVAAGDEGQDDVCRRRTIRRSTAASWYKAMT
jgi:hypothetical protein